MNPNTPTSPLVPLVPQVSLDTHLGQCKRYRRAVRRALHEAGHLIVALDKVDDRHARFDVRKSQPL